ncbi:hypothetical protein D1007_12041 [Hordeum vulgare]|nr:hypothetical protein D1007_12041 [Hordeum vulgare]
MARGRGCGRAQTSVVTLRTSSQSHTDGVRNAPHHYGHGSVPPLPTRANPPPWDVVQEFVVSLHQCPHSWLRPPDPFPRSMEGSRPAGLWVRADGCRNRPIWVMVDFSPGGAIFLTRGCESFAHSHDLGSDHLLHFRFDGETMLWVRFFGSSGNRLDCCAESSSDSGLDTSSDDEDDNSLPDAMIEGNDFE